MAIAQNATFQSTLPTRGSDSALYFSFCAERCISIHAPHEGERRKAKVLSITYSDISIHAPHEGERHRLLLMDSDRVRFQSTLPTRGSDYSHKIKQGQKSPFQSTLPTRGSDETDAVLRLMDEISIHAPHEGERPPPIIAKRTIRAFQSTLPTRGSDSGRAAVSIAAHYFNPRSPRGGATRPVVFPLSIAKEFQSTLPTRGSDSLVLHLCLGQQQISIHAPHEGERQRKSAFVYSISANLLNIIHCGTVTRAVSRRRIALFRLFSVRRSGVFMYAYASH